MNSIWKVCMFWSTVDMWGLVYFRGFEFPELAVCLRQWRYGRSVRVVLVSAVCARGNRKILTQAVLNYLSCATKGGLWTDEQAVVWSNPAHNGRTQSWLLLAGLAETWLVTQLESPASKANASGLVGYLAKMKLERGNDRYLIPRLFTP